MARRADAPKDPVIVRIEDDEPAITFDQWLTLLATDAPTDVNVGAAEILREIRQDGET